MTCLTERSPIGSLTEAKLGLGAASGSMNVIYVIYFWPPVRVRVLRATNREKKPGLAPLARLADAM